MTKRLILCWLVGCGIATSVYADSFEPLDKIARRAKSFSEFILNEEWVADYRRELIRVFGRDRFLCESFDEILADLRAINARVPGFGAALWKVAEDNDPPETIIVRTGDNAQKFVLRSLR